MSYENPEQFVDKQSGQHFRRMQESITKAATSTIASYVDTYKRNQIRIQKITEEADKAALDAKNAVFQTASKNSTIQFQNIDKKFSRLAELKKKNPNKLTDKERNFIRSMDTIGTRMYSSLENTTASSLAFKEQSGIKPGAQGSNDQFRNPDQYLTMSIMNGTIPGSKEAVFEEDENGNVVYSVVVKDRGGKEVGRVLNKDMETTLFIDKVPNLQPQLNEAIAKAKAKLNIQSEFSPAYIKDGELAGKLMVGVNGKGVAVSEEVWNKALQAEIDLIVLGLAENDKSSFHNNVSRTKNTKNDKGDIVKDDFSNLWKYDQDLTPEQNTNFTQELLKYANSEVEAVKAKNKVMRKDKDKKGGKFRYEFTQSMKAKDPIIRMGTGPNSMVWEFKTKEVDGKDVEGYSYQPPASAVTGEEPAPIFVPYMKGKNINYTGLRAAMGLKATKI